MTSSRSRQRWGAGAMSRHAAVALAVGLVGFAAGSAAAAPPAEAAGPAVASGGRLEAALRATSGGLRADEVAARVERESPAVRAGARAVDAARARVDQAAAAFAPRVTILGRYVRSSSITPPNLGDYLPVPPGTTVDFPVILDVYSLQGTLQVPLSDYALRLTQNHAAATRSQAAARLSEVAARRKAQRDGRIAFYNWARARAAVVVADQALVTARGHAADVRAALVAGTASRADLLRVESQVAQAELLVERARNLAGLAEEQLMVMLHDPAGTTYALGEDLTGAPPAPAPELLPDLYAEALTQRPEARALGESAAALRATAKVVRAGYYPRVDAFANAYEQNPNFRFFPQQSKWRFTWDVGVQLTWTINDTFTTPSQLREVRAKGAELEAQRAALADAIRLEVRQAANAVREARVALETTVRQRQAAEESYRVRRDLFRTGRATSAELTDAESDLVRALLDVLNARIDARIALVSLEHALGRDRQPRAGAGSPPRPDRATPVARPSRALDRVVTAAPR